MAAATTSLSWSSSSFLNNRTLTTNSNNQPSIIPPSSPFLVLAQKKAKKTRKIILIEDVTDVGKKGQLLDVKAGFYRNFLHPSGKARIVTTDLIKESRVVKLPVAIFVSMVISTSLHTFTLHSFNGKYCSILGHMS
nr:50S ribosomal protein L9, chloroplastic [Tanacetum cinerariifolium]